MNYLQNAKFVNVLDPVSAAASAITMDNEIDTKGFDYCTVVFQLGSANGAVTELHLEQSDAGGGSGFSEVGVEGFDFSSGIESDVTNAALPGASDDDNLFVFEVDTRGLKRYLRLEYTSGGSANLSACVAILSRASETSNVPADRGALGLISG